MFKKAKLTKKEIQEHIAKGAIPEDADPLDLRFYPQPDRSGMTVEDIRKELNKKCYTNIYDRAFQSLLRPFINGPNKTVRIGNRTIKIYESEIIEDADTCNQMYFIKEGNTIWIRHVECDVAKLISIIREALKRFNKGGRAIRNRPAGAIYC